MIIASEAKTNTINAQEIMRLEKIKKEIERKERFDQMVLETIKFCDTDLSIIISKDSIKGNNMVVLQWGEDTNNEFKSVYRPLKEEENRYDYKESPSLLKNEKINLVEYDSFYKEQYFKNDLFIDDVDIIKDEEVEKIKKEINKLEIKQKLKENKL